MSQSSVILATLLAGFIAYLALNGKLETYWSLLAGGGTKAAGASSGGQSNTPAAGGVSPGGVLDFSQLAGDLVNAFDPSAFLSAGSSLAALGAL